jgi:hypothetical protein
MLFIRTRTSDQKESQLPTAKRECEPRWYIYAMGKGMVVSTSLWKHVRGRAPPAGGAHDNLHRLGGENVYSG